MYHDDDPVRVVEALGERVAASRDVLKGVRPGGRPGRSMFDHEVISFAHGDGQKAPPPAVIAAGIAALVDQARFPLHRYSFLERHEALEDTIRATMRGEGFPEAHGETLCVDAGTTKLIQSFLRAVTEPGDAVLVAPTFYHGVVGWARLLRLGIQVVPTRAANAFKLDEASIGEAVANSLRWGRRPRVLIVFNPTQTGAVYSTADIREIATSCARYDLHVVEDAIFGRTRFDQGRPIAHLAADPVLADRVVTVDGCSKADGLANVRIGWAFGPARILAEMEAIKAATTVGLPYVASELARSALSQPRAVRELRASACERRVDAVIHAIDELNTTLHLERAPMPRLRVVHRPEAGHSVMVDAAGASVEGEPAPVEGDNLDLAERWLDGAAVAVSPLGSSALGGSEIRLNVACVTDPFRSGVVDDPCSWFPAGEVGAAVTGDRRAQRELLARLERIGDITEPSHDHIPDLIRHGIVDRIGAAQQTRARRVHL